MARVSGWHGEQHQSYLEEQKAKLAAAGLSQDFEHVESPDLAAKSRFFRSIDVLSVPTAYREPKGLYVLEVPQGASTTPERHLYEEVFVVLEGSGHTEVWVEGSVHDTVEWRRNTVFTVPLNAMHTHVADQHGPAVLLCGNNAPPVMQLYRSSEFVFCTEFHFAERYVPGTGFYDVGPLTKDGDEELGIVQLAGERVAVVAQALHHRLALVDQLVRQAHIRATRAY